MRESLDVRDEGDLLRQDTAARAEALDVSRSFLVQAPAGSGKTELLIQRCLALLARVDEPERILALTFTRKAAGEMRERVVEALAHAARELPVDADKPQARVTRDLARAVLEQDARRGWSLTDHPARLRIVTFDSLTTWIVRSAPFAAMLGPVPGYADEAKGLYAEAAAAAIAGADAADSRWRRLLVHLHNDAEQTAKLLARLLGKRDQLLRQIGVGDPCAVRQALITALEDEAKAALDALQRALPGEVAPEIARLARYAARELAGDASQAGRVAALIACADCGGVPACTVECLPLWRALAGWLLTQDGATRTAIDRRMGFPPPGKDPGKADRAAAKQAMENLLDCIRAVPGLADTMHGVATMPTPAALGPDAWEVVEALLAIVPQVVAQLSLTFAERGVVDFTQASIAALTALGDADAPSELLQRLDYRLAHLLVDEFQDTSATQLEVLKRLTSGWTPGEDGRTVFAVGDPMQSIYRFREAEVRLFVEAQRSGQVAGVPVECLTLRRNFRSQKAIVDWVNAAFPAVLGRVSDPMRGAVAFEPATPAKRRLPGVGVTFDPCTNARDEARVVVSRVREALSAGATEIAILVRARAHLREVLPALREADIPFTAVELDKLGQRQAVQDLISLTHALLQPGDRLAWLAVLRAPWCGLVLADLLALADAAVPPQLLVNVLGDPQVCKALSPEGRARLDRVRPLLDAALAAHGRASVAARVRGAWLALGGPACLSDPVDLESADRYFDVLAAHERAGDVPDWAGLRGALDELHASPESMHGIAVRVMTMHKAKGLQFDTVILPGLGRKGRGAAHDLLRWRSRERGLLIAPSKSPGADADPIYDYLGRLEEEESSAEHGRLLYVACTRAIARLHLVAAAPVREDKEGNVEWRPVSSSSLAKLWPALAATAQAAQLPAETDEDATPAPPLMRLPADYVPATADDSLMPLAPVASDAQRDVPFDWAQQRARAIGTIAHRLLARMAEAGVWNDARLASLSPRVRAELASAGFAADEADASAQRVIDVIRRTLSDARGRWIFDPSHADARSEWSITGVDGGAIVHLVLDRTFVVDGERWIVDFKIGTHEGADVAGFLDSEAERYRPQLVRYGRLVQALDERPVRLALYYPLLEGGFRELRADGS